MTNGEADGFLQATQEVAVEVHDDSGDPDGVLAGEPRGQSEAAFALVKDENGPGALAAFLPLIYQS